MTSSIQLLPFFELTRLLRSILRIAEAGKRRPLRMPVQHMGRDIWPELTESIGQRVPSKRVSVFGSESADSPRLARIVGERDSLGDASTQQLRNVERIVPLVVGGNENSSAGIS